MSKIVIALGGNALQSKDSAPTAQGQLSVIKKTCERIADISQAGHELAIVHGNGPQIGRIILASETARDVTPVMPFDVCGAMSQGYIGYQIQQSLKYALSVRNKNCPVLTVATQMVVDQKDPGFLNPQKPIGPFYTQEEAEKLEKENGYVMKEDAKVLDEVVVVGMDTQKRCRSWMAKSCGVTIAKAHCGNSGN